MGPGYEVAEGESDLVAVVVQKVDDPNFPFLKINIRQISSSCIIFLLLFQSNLEVEVGLVSLRGHYGGDCVAAVILVAVNDDGGVSVQLLVVKDDGWAEQGVLSFELYDY